MSKIDTVRAAMMQAMKDKDKERKDALSLLLSALKSKQIDKRADLTEEEENAVIFRARDREDVDAARQRQGGRRAGESGAGQLFRVTNFEIKKPRVETLSGIDARLFHIQE